MPPPPPPCPSRAGDAVCLFSSRVSRRWTAPTGLAASTRWLALRDVCEPRRPGLWAAPKSESVDSRGHSRFVLRILISLVSTPPPAQDVAQVPHLGLAAFEADRKPGKAARFGEPILRKDVSRQTRLRHSHVGHCISSSSIIAWGG